MPQGHTQTVGGQGSEITTPLAPSPVSFHVDTLLVSSQWQSIQHLLE